MAADAGTAMGGKAATAPDSMNRQGQLYAKKSLYETLENTRVEHLKPAERAQFDKLEPAWDQFFIEDDKVVTPPLPEGSGFSLSSAKVGDGQALPVSSKKTVTGKRFPCRVNPAVPSLDLKALWGTLAAALLLATVLSVRVTRSVVRPLTVVVDALGRVARGDLTVRLGMTRRDELGHLGRALDDTTEALRTTVSTVIAHSDSLTTSSTHLSQVSARIAASAEEAGAQSGVVGRFTV
ncbi:HAMP domain-containing protein [Planomonospora algeriensis]